MCRQTQIPTNQELEYALKLFNYFFTGIFIIEAGMKVGALGLARYLSDRLNSNNCVCTISLNNPQVESA